MKRRPGFSQRHPLLFGLILLATAMALMLGAMAFFRGGSGAARWTRGERLGVVNVTGVILESKAVVEFLDELRKDPGVKGVLLRVNSPGGAIAPSQEIYRAVRRLAGIKPVVASFGQVAASGGYYVSAPATRIVANPGSLTASIGVKVDYLDLQGLLADWGVRRELLASGAIKGAGSPFEHLTDAQRKSLMGVVMDMHDQFVDDVSEARHMDREAVARLADGSAMTGRQALAAGLVDELGGFDEALTRLKVLADVAGEPELTEGPVKDRSVLERLTGAQGDLGQGLRGLVLDLLPRVQFLYQQ
ncbi:MAG: signal peptide peptidase SppA [Desulfovibrionaceae bacterium]